MYTGIYQSLESTDIPLKLEKLFFLLFLEHSINGIKRFKVSEMLNERKHSISYIVALKVLSVMNAVLKTLMLITSSECCSLLVIFFFFLHSVQTISTVQLHLPIVEILTAVLEVSMLHRIRFLSGYSWLEKCRLDS